MLFTEYVGGRIPMRTTMKMLTMAAAGLVTVMSPALGHHGDAGRYTETVTTVIGAVVEFQFINPHSMLIILV